MAAAAEPKKRIKVTFPQPVFDLLVADVPPGKRSAFIGTATEEGLRRKLLELGPDSRLFTRIWPRSCSARNRATLSSLSC